MGLFDLFTGSKAAAPGVTRIPAADLRTALLALNRDGAPWQVRDGGPEGCDLVAEWKIVDARWYEIFAKASLSKVFKVLMKFDEAKGEIRTVDQEFTVEWRAGVPSLSASVKTALVQTGSYRARASTPTTAALAPRIDACAQGRRRKPSQNGSMP